MSVSSDDLVPLHTRDYRVAAFRVDAATLLLRGEVEDVKPPGVYFADDPDPLTVHHMVVELTISVPTLDIVGAEVVFQTHPHAICPAIAVSYQQLVGMSIARGFNAKVRKLFGGPLGCTHTTALLSAMAPVALQSAWSLNTLARQGANDMIRFNPEARAQVVASSVNTCHVWVEDGEHHREMRDTEHVRPAIPMQVRLRQLGRDA
jgi:hypothetical protein